MKLKLNVQVSGEVVGDFDELTEKHADIDSRLACCHEEFEALFMQFFQRRFPEFKLNITLSCPMGLEGEPEKF